MVILLFLLKILFFFGFSSISVYSLLTRNNKDNKSLNLLYSLGIGPGLSTLFLYYLLVLLPGFSSYFYIAFLLLINIIIYITNYKSIIDYFKVIKRIFFQIVSIFNFKISLKDYLFQTHNLFIIILLIVSFGGLNILLFNLMPGHDFFEYMVQGKYFFENKSINYVEHHYNFKTGFYYVGLHGWSFPLHSTIELMFDDIFYFGYHLYFKSLTLIYGLLILSIIYLLVKRYTDIFYSLSVVIILLLTKGFIVSIYYFHIDSYRIYFFILSFILIISYLNKPSLNTLITLSIVSGISSFSHSLGVFICIIFFLVLLLFCNSRTNIKARNISLFIVLLLLFGGIHYVIDVFYGTGWIIKSLKFY